MLMFLQLIINHKLKTVEQQSNYSKKENKTEFNFLNFET